MHTIMSICKTHCKAKSNITNMQNPNRANVATTKILEKGFLETLLLPKTASFKNDKKQSETSVNTYQTWRLKVKMREYYITCDYLVAMPRMTSANCERLSQYSHNTVWM